MVRSAHSTRVSDGQDSYSGSRVPGFQGSRVPRFQGSRVPGPASPKPPHSSQECAKVGRGFDKSVVAAGLEPCGTKADGRQTGMISTWRPSRVSDPGVRVSDPGVPGRARV